MEPQVHISSILKEFNPKELNLVHIKTDHGVSQLIFEQSNNYQLNVNEFVDYISKKFARTWTKSGVKRLTKPQGQHWPWIDVSFGSKKKGKMMIPLKHL